MITRAVLTAGLALVAAAVALPRARAEPAPSVDASTLTLRADLDGGLTSWLIAGGFKWGRSTRAKAFARDHVGAATADPRQGDEVEGAARSWRLHLGRTTKVNLRALCKPRVRSAAYAFARVVVPTDRAARLLVGSDDGVRVWLNGALVFERLVKRKHVADSELIPVRLRAGVNRLLLKIDQTGGRWAFSARLVDARGAPMADLREVLRLDEDADLAALEARAFQRAARTRLRVELREEGSVVGARVRLVAAPPDLAEPLVVTATIQGGPTLRREARSDELLREAVELRGPFDPRRPLRTRLTVRDARGRVLLRKTFGRKLPRALVSMAFAAERDLRHAVGAKVPRASLDSVAYELQRGRALLENGDGDFVYARKLLRAARSDARALARGRDPYRSKRQAFYRAYRSPHDDSLQHYATYVPSGYRRGKKYPLVVALHGFKSTTMITLRRALGSSIHHLSYADGDRKLPRFKEGRFLVAAPRGYGNIAFRYIAEEDILRVIDEMKRAYSVDEDRIYLTGLSMGGLGTMEVGLHHADRFAGLISNCGAADTRIYESIEGYKPEVWETDLIEGRSAVLWAENGLHVPFFIAHGLKDPINQPRNSRVLVKEYERLGYEVDSRFDPDLGHNVWDRTYEGGEIWTEFLKYRRDPKPLRVVFKSAHVRYGSLYWLRLHEWARPWGFARVDARVDPKANAVRATTSNLRRFSIVLAQTRLDPARAVRVEIDGRLAHEGPAAARVLTFEREIDGAPWRAASAAAERSPGSVARSAGFLSVFGQGREEPPLRKDPGLSGPIEDFKYVRQLLVYGSQDPAEEPVLRRAALEAASYHSNSGITLAVKRDTDVTDEDLARSHLHLFGTPRSNSWLRKIEDRLPLKVTSEGVLVGRTLHRGDDVGFKLIYPNPLRPERYVMVSAAVHAHAVGWANWLPLWAPDYMVYDQRTVAPRWGKILAGRKARAAGYFDRAWRLRDTAEKVR